MKATLLAIILTLSTINPTGEKLVEVVCMDGSIHWETLTGEAFSCNWKQLVFH